MSVQDVIHNMLDKLVQRENNCHVTSGKFIKSLVEPENVFKGKLNLQQFLSGAYEKCFYFFSKDQMDLI